MTRLALVVLALALLSASSGALAQPGGRPTPARRGELVLYSDTHFRGRTFFVDGATPNLNVPFNVRSYAMAPGDSWVLCTRPNFAPDCGNFYRDEPDRGAAANIAIRSARPIGGPPSFPGGPEFPSSGFAGPSLRGMASEFFRAPEVRGQRVPACAFGPATGRCAADTASRFCRARGYAGGSASQRLETVRGQTFLADVLCSPTGA